MQLDTSIFRKVISYFEKDLIFKNSIFLMFSSAISTGFGFIFWILAAKFYSVSDIGITSSYIAAINLITFLAILGFDQALIKYIPISKNKYNLISTCFLLSGIISFFLWLIYLIFITDLKNQNISFILIIFISILSSVNVLFVLLESVYISFRKSYLVLAMNTILGIFKSILPLFLAFLGFYGLIVSYNMPLLIALVIVLVLSPIRFIFKINLKEVYQIFRFSITNYLSDAIPLIRVFLASILLMILFGPEQVAFFYMAFNIKAIFLIIPFAISKILFSEHSITKKNLFLNVRKWMFYVLFATFFLSVVTIVFGQYILSIFGKIYAVNSYMLLIFFSITSIPYGIIQPLTSIFKINNKSIYLLVSNLLGLVATMITFVYLKNFLLVGLGIAWLVGDIISLAYLMLKIGV